MGPLIGALWVSLGTSVVSSLEWCDVPIGTSIFSWTPSSKDGELTILGAPGVTGERCLLPPRSSRSQRRDPWLATALRSQGQSTLFSALLVPSPHASCTLLLCLRPRVLSGAASTLGVGQASGGTPRFPGAPADLGLGTGECSLRRVNHFALNT